VGQTKLNNELLLLLDWSKDDEVGGTRSTRVGDKKCIQDCS